jgi:hypothetical protein
VGDQGEGAVSVEFQYRRLREIETEKGRRWGAAIFEREEEEEARRLHAVRER